MDRLSVEDSTAAEIAGGLGVPAEAVRRRLRKLAAVGLVTKAEQTRRRGVAEHLYTRDLGGLRVGPADMIGLSPRLLEEQGARLLRKIVGEASIATEAGTFGSRPESTVIRFPMAVDDALLAKVARLHEELLAEIIASVGRGRARLESRGDLPIEATAALILAPAERASWLGQLKVAADGTHPSGRLSRRHPVDLLATVQDPVRSNIIDVVTVFPSSAKEIAGVLGLSPERTRGELKRLLDAGAIAVHDQRPRRGTREYFYVAQNRALTLSVEDVTGYDGGMLDLNRRQTLRMVFGEALESIRSGMIARFQEDHHLSRVPMRVDAQGFQEISELMEGTLDQLIRVKEDRQQRWVMGDPPPPLVATSGMLLFERAPCNCLTGS